MSIASGADGRRGSRSGSPPAPPRRAGVPAPAPDPVPARPVAVRARSRRGWLGPVVGLAAGVLLGRLASGAPALPGDGRGVERVLLVITLLLVGLAAIAAARVARRRPPPPAVGAAVVAGPVAPLRPPAVSPDTDLERGVRDIRRRDRGFDPARFAGYAAMMLRDVQRARVARDAGVLRERLTPAMYAEFQARCEGLRTSGRSARVADVEVVPEVTEAWQEGDRDYVTAYVAGSMLSHTVDDATGTIVEGSPTIPGPVAAFLTFTRPAGLNFWRLSLIQEHAAAAPLGAGA